MKEEEEGGRERERTREGRERAMNSEGGEGVCGGGVSREGETKGRREGGRNRENEKKWSRRRAGGSGNTRETWDGSLIQN